MTIIKQIFRKNECVHLKKIITKDEVSTSTLPIAKPMLGDILIRVFCGISIEDKCRHQLHPLNEVVQAQKILSLNKSTDLFSNSPDFVSAIKYICHEKQIKCEFFLDGKSVGINTEPIFDSFNKSFDLLNDLCPTRD